MKTHIVTEAHYQFGIGGCRAPEAPNPFSLPEYDVPFLWDQSIGKDHGRKTKVPVIYDIN